ncbi:MAG: DUF1492 domain-containing protein [Candidatus Ornithomonoglobus sp.]
MTTKEWLIRGYRIDTEINALIKERDKALLMATSATADPGGEKVQTSRRNTSEDKFVNYAAYEETINKRLDELYEIKNEISQAISKVKDDTLRKLLILRYINFEKWERIAGLMGYDERHVRRLHGKALQAAKDVLECPL